MADKEQVVLLKQGWRGWNEWRRKNPGIRPDLTQADLTGADLSGAHLTQADLTGADLSVTRLIQAHLIQADLTGADLNTADLSMAHLIQADLTGANLSGAHLIWAHLMEADLSGAHLLETVFGDTDLTAAKGLDSCKHKGPSTIDYRTLVRSWPLPLAFLRGCGLPDPLINYLLSLLNEPTQFYSCFISHSSKDHEFADRLYADLWNKGVLCWFAPEDLKIGDRFRVRIDESIRTHDKLLLILSEHSVSSEWVEKEVETAMEKEREDKRTILFPVRLDNVVMESKTGWAADVRRTRHIGDFTGWKDHDDYQKGFTRLLRDLKAADKKE
jgi:hypothetical protein